jgi:hypothetical protein
MALSPQLLQFKSSGVYRLEFDKSQTVNIPAETIRLIVGHSKKGPFNTPTFVEDVAQFTNIYGNIDSSLEKKGMYFHRSAIAALQRGPILALNLAAMDAGDIVNGISLPTNSSANQTAVPSTPSYSDMHNTDKFWFPNSDIAIQNETDFSNDDRVLNFINLKGENISIIVKQSTNTAGFEVKASEWFGFNNVPSYMSPDDFISDFMVDVYVFAGKYDAAALDVDPVFGSYFKEDANSAGTYGLDKDQLNSFANLKQVSLVAQYTGSLLPNFTDQEGRNLNIETLINLESSRTGLFCILNEAAIEENDTMNALDIVGHDYNAGYTILSYSEEETISREVTLAGTVDVISSSVFEYDLNYFDPTTVNVTGNSNIIGAANSLVIEGINVTSSFPTTKYVKLDDDSFTPILTSTFANGDTTITFVGTLLPADVLVPKAYTASVHTNDLAKGMYVPADASGRMAKITRITTTTTTNLLQVTTSEAYDFDTTPKAYKSFESNASIYLVHNLDKFVAPTLTIKECLDTLVGTKLKDALVDKDNITFRYIVDTFGSYEAANGLLNKYQLSSLAMERQNASAILNAPMVKEFKMSVDPSFVDMNGNFESNYVKDGGNLALNPTSIYALPDITTGASYGFWYGPGVNVRENGKNLVIPPAAYVSNNYIAKYSADLPWSIVAGPRRGVVSGPGVTGAEYAFDKKDRDNLEPFGINPIVFQRGSGLVITGNKTGQQTIKSALSSAHVREVLIYIQDGLAAILKNYVFEFNTAQTRLEIKTLADSFMESVKSDTGVFEYRNVMDSTNNTSEVIDANIGILDTFVEPVKGLEIVVSRTTVLNTGEIATGNFS